MHACMEMGRVQQGGGPADNGTDDPSSRTRRRARTTDGTSDAGRPGASIVRHDNDAGLEGVACVRSGLAA